MSLIEELRAAMSKDITEQERIENYREYFKKCFKYPRYATNMCVLKAQQK